MQNVLEQLLTALTERSAFSVIGQSGFASEVLRRHLREVLAKPAGIGESFLADPVFEAAFGWQASQETMADLEGHLLDPALLAALDASEPIDPAERNDKYRFGREWHPHRHQLTAWHALGQDPARSVLVKSGTGSGKTECFLLPVLNDLAQQRRALGRLQGVQALFIYPLNALINSQRDRLTDWTHAFSGDVRYCLYNGDTLDEVPESEQRRRPSQVLSRKVLRRDPPPILLTNITMLEYLLIRAIDAPIIDRSKGKLKWIVLDEAHSYVGSQAAEVALLLRRVMRAFGVSGGDVRFVATSATIGDGDEIDEKLRKFLSDIAGVSEDRVLLIKGERSIPLLPGGVASTTFPDLETLSVMTAEDAYAHLAASAPMRRLREEIVAGPVKLTMVQRTLGQGDRSPTQPSIALGLLEQAARAECHGDRFLPLKVHLFHRAQSGLWACINPQCSGRASTALDSVEWIYGRVFAHEVERCGSCSSPVFELARCTDCGAPVLTVEETDDGCLRPVRDVNQVDEFAQDVEPARDESDGSGSNDAETINVAEKRLITRCGIEGAQTAWIDRRSSKVLDAPDPSAIKVGLTDGAAECLSCGAVDHTRQGELFRTARFGAPFLLGNIVPQLLEFAPPRPRGEGPRLPAEGRQVLTFTDSRQGTARFAAKLQQDAERNFIRSAVYHVVHAASAGNHAPEEIAALEAEVATLKATAGLSEVIRERHQHQCDRAKPHADRPHPAALGPVEPGGPAGRDRAHPAAPRCRGAGPGQGDLLPGVQRRRFRDRRDHRRNRRKLTMATYVLVHGSFQGGWIWQPVVNRLRAAGHQVYAPSLDGCGERKDQMRPGITTETQADEVAQLLFYEDLKDVVLVGTSYGGMVACRAAELMRERIGRLVFVDALTLFDGEKVADILPRTTSVADGVTLRPSPEDAATRLFADLDPKTRAWALERYTPHPIAFRFEPVKLDSFWSQQWKASVIWCRQAQNPGEAHQRRAADRLGAKWVELDTGHYPMLSMPTELTALLTAG